jgi:hypothetical protein
MELNTLCVVGMHQQVDALAFLAHDADADGHGSSIHQVQAAGFASVRQESIFGKTPDGDCGSMSEIA